MARVKRGVIARARHKKILKQAKGYYGARSRVIRALPSRLLSKLVSTLTVTVVNVNVSSGQLWIARINAAARQNGISTANSSMA
ncbi:50S ribosomal protein L20 [Klebsiella variicola subsp. variicola]|nr:50S ribosomal protein L20 [Klebsiella variicola subsp. variicola]